MKPETEALICAAQEQAISTNYTKFKIDKSVDSQLCRLCRGKGESVGHLASECTKLAQREYRSRHDNVTRIIRWKICGKHDLERASKWHEHAPQGVVKTDKVKVLWNFLIQCDHQIECRKPDIVVVNKAEKKCAIIGVAIPGDNRIGEKETVKMEKYQALKREIKNLWSMRKIEVIPVIVGALGRVSMKFEQWIERIGITVNVEDI